MEKVLKVYTYINSELKKPFPNEKEQIEISAFVYSAKRMGAAPSISATIKHAQCLDELWTGAEYVEFRGEKYFLRSTPTSSYDNTDVRYKHECYFQSERILLENVYYYDVVSTNDDDKPTSNNTNFSFFGTIFEFVKRINSSLNRSGITGYNIVVDEDVEEDEKNLIPKSVSFQNQFIGNVIQEIYNTYKIPYYFVGKTIHVGFHEKIVPTKLKYGINDSLLSITKTNANNKIVNRITATGSTENIPYYYPNESSKGKLGVIVEKGDIVAQIINPEIFAQTVSTTEKLVYSKNDGLLETALDSLLVRKLSKNNSAIETIVSSSDPSKIEYKGVSVQDGDYVNIIARARFGAWSEGSYSFEVKKGTADSGSNVAKIYKIEISTIYDDDSNLDSVEKVFDYGDGITDKSITVDFDFKHALIGNVRFFEVSVYMNQTPNNGAKELSYSNTLSFVGKDTSLVWKNESRSTKKKDISDYGLSISGTPSIGDTIGQKIIEYITPQPTLMPPLYRRTGGGERFYNAVNGTYEGFHFDNPFIEGRPSEYIVNLDHIKPTIEGMEVNKLRIDMFSEFAYDNNDNDEFVSDGGTSEKLLHPYFFGKLRKMDFNLFDHAIESGEMTVAMTSGACASCNFVIQVDSPETQKNSVQVNSDGTLKKDERGNVVFGKPQDQQNDTINNEVWIALKKEQSTFGIVMPNYSANYKPKASSSNNNDGDTFVFLNINLPQGYISAAERKLEHEMLTYMSQNNSEKFNFSIKFSRIFLEENQDVFENLTENSIVTVEYNGNEYGLYVSSYTYRMNNGDILPEITVELFDTLAITQNVIQKAVSEVKSDLLSVSTVVDAYKSSMSKSIRKDKSDSTPFKLTTGDMLVKKRMPTGFSEESGGNLDVEGKATVGGDTNVQGNFTVQRDANIEKNLSVKGNSSVKGDMNVEGEATFNQSVQALKEIVMGLNAEGKDKVLRSAIYEAGMKGWAVDKNGNAELESLKVRGYLETEELRINRLQGQEGDTIFTDNDKIEAVEEGVDETDGTTYYTLTLAEKWKGYFTAQQYGNICKGIVNTLAENYLAQQQGREPSVNINASGQEADAGGNKYFTSWFYVVATHNTDSRLGLNQIRVVLFGESQIPQDKNFAPCVGMSFGRWGCLNYATSDTPDYELADIKRRQSLFYISVSEGRIMHLKGVYQPILENWMFGTTMGELPDFVKNNESIKDRLVDNADYFYSQGVVVSDFIKVGATGAPVPVTWFCGDWVDGSKIDNPTIGNGIYLASEYNPDNRQYEVHEVRHKSGRWRCLQHQPVVINGEVVYHEPKWNSHYWRLIDGNENYNILFQSSRGMSFHRGHVDTEVTPKLMYGNVDISEDVTEQFWSWKRYTDTGETLADKAWSAQHEGVNVLHLTNEDMPQEWNSRNRAVFEVSVTLDDGKEQIIISNYIIA